MDYDIQIEIIEADLEAKNYRKDRHGVMDCAADLREIEAEKRGYSKGYQQALIDAKSNPLILE